MKPSCLFLAIALFLPAVLHAAPTTTLEEFAASSPHGPSLAEAVEQARHAARPVEDAPGQWWVQNPANGLNARSTPEGLAMSVSVADADGRAEAGRLFIRWRTAAVPQSKRAGAASSRSSDTGSWHPITIIPPAAPQRAGIAVPGEGSTPRWSSRNGMAATPPATPARFRKE